MTWKKVSNSDAGTATKHGGNDIDKMADAFNGVDVSDPIKYNTDINTLYASTNAAGDLLKSNGTKFVRLPRGTANQVLAVNSGGTDLAWATGAGGGEANTAANVGTGTGQIFRDKTSVTLNLKTLLAGSNITLTNNANDVTIAATGGAASFAELGGPLYTAYIAGTTVKLRNNITGAVDYTADNTVNAITALQSALNNIDTIANVDANYGAVIELTPGVYKCTTQLDLSQATTGRHGLGIIGNGVGTVLNFVPGSALTNAILFKESWAQIRNLSLRINTNVTNAIQIQGVTLVKHSGPSHGSNGIIDGLTIQGTNAGGTEVAQAGQRAIYMEGTDPTFFWKIINNTIQCFDQGLYCAGTYSTSTYTANNTFFAVITSIDLNSAQHNIHNNWCQAGGGTGSTGVRLRAAATYNNIINLICELNEPNAQSVLIDSGANKNTIINTSNVYATAPTSGTICVIRDSSGNTTNNYQYRYSNDQYSHNQVIKGSWIEDVPLYNTATTFNTQTMKAIGTDKECVLEIEPSHTTVSGARFGGMIRFRNTVSGTNAEWMHLAAFGTSGYIFYADKAGTGVIRDIVFRANTVDAMKLKGTTQEVELTNSTNILLGTGAGTKIGTATGQKLGFYNATPIVQGASVADATGGSTIDAQARTAINSVISRLEALGLIATV